MSSSGLNWVPIFEAWLKQRNPRIENILRTCIETTFFKTYDWARQTLIFKMPVLECNIVFQVISTSFKDRMSSVKPNQTFWIVPALSNSASLSCTS